MTTKIQKPIKLFISYSHKDDDLRAELNEHLTSLKREGIIETWFDRMIEAGDEFDLAIEEHLNSADIILLLISRHFFASDYCYDKEMTQALKRHDEKRAKVVPVILRDCVWKIAPFQKLKALPDDGKAVTSSAWRNNDEAFTRVTAEIQEMVDKMSRTSAETQPVDGAETMGRQQLPPLPEVFISRPAKSGEVMPHLLSKDPSTGVNIAALLGPSGFGKTTLAKNICQEIKDDFPGGIFWKELSETSGDLESFAQQVLGNERRSLIVIDNLCNSEQLRPFMKEKTNHAILITTQLRGVLRGLVSKDCRVDVTGMDLDEAVDLLISGLENKTITDQEKKELEGLATDLGRWPVILSPVSHRLAECAEDSATLQDAVAVLRNDLMRHGLFTFDPDNAVMATIEICLGRLSDTDRSLYKSLAVFPKDVSVPLATIEKYWVAAAWIEEAKTYEHCQTLRNASLLQSLRHGIEGRLQLHNVFREYLVKIQPDSLVELHKHLLNSYAPPPIREALPETASPEGNYIWKYLAFHLIGAGRDDELIDTVKDWQYLARKTVKLGPLSVEGDLLDAEKVARNDRELKSLSRSFANSGHLFNRCRAVEDIKEVERINEIEATLFARLQHLDELQAMLDKLKRSLKTPYVVPAPGFALPDLPHPALIRTLEGHTSSIEDCTFSPDGERIVSASSDSTVKVWNANGEMLQSFKEHSAPVHNCAFIQRGHLVASISKDCTLKLWEADSGKIQHTREGQFDIVLGRAFSRDGERVVSTSPDGTLKVWETVSGNPLCVLEGHPEIVKLEDDEGVMKFVNSCVFSPESRHLVSASSVGTLKVWRAESPGLLREFTGRLETVLSWDPDGKKIVSTPAEEDWKLKVWNSESGDVLLTLKNEKPVNGCAFSPDGKQIVTASSDFALTVWDAEKGEMLGVLEGHSNAVNTCAFSADGRRFLSASSDGTLKIWDAELIRLPRSHSVSAVGCAFSRDGKRIASAFSDGTLKVWDVNIGELLNTYSEHSGSATGCSFSGELIVSSSSDRSLKIWEADLNKSVRTLETKMGKNKTTDEERGEIEGHTESVNGCAFSPDGKLIVSASSDRTLKVWEVSGRVRTLRDHSDSVLSCAFSPDGDLIVSASADGKVKVWRSKVEEPPRTLNGHSKSVNSCAFSPYGEMIVSASNDYTLKIWGTYSGDVQAELVGHSAPVRGCGFSPDGELIVSASEDRTLKIWDVLSGRCLTTFYTDGPMYCCAIHEDMIVAGGERGVYFLKLVRQIEEEKDGLFANCCKRPQNVVVTNPAF